MIEENVYQGFLKSLLAGRLSECHAVVTQLLDAKTEIRDLYINLFQRSMYEVGELWENNRITVANEHLATSITESLLSLVYPSIFATERSGKKAVVSCSANEFHQIGGKMVADIMELNGWDGHFLGANTPPEEMTKFIDEVRPDVVGISLSIPANIGNLVHGIEVVKADFPDMDLLIGGQAFRWIGQDAIRHYTNTDYVSSLDALESLLGGS